MSKIAFDSGDDQIAANHAEVLHREAYAAAVLTGMGQTSRSEEETAYDRWYLSTLEEGVMRRALVIEYRAWGRHLEDLLRDQLSRNGIDSGHWDDVKEAADGGGFVARARGVLSKNLEAELPQELWERLEELAAVAEVIIDGTAEARAILAERYPEYFHDMDVFGDGDIAGRLTLRREQLARAFAATKAFWDPEHGVPYHLIEGAA
jgi:hypothetical protein